MTFLEKTGVALMGSSWVFTASILLLPFMEIEHNRVVVAGGIYFIGQVIFWIGCAIGGKELVRRYRRWFPWLSWVSRLWKKAE